MAEKRRNISAQIDNGQRLNAGFSDARERLYSDILADNLPKKTIQHYLRTYNRLFNEFLSLKFPQLNSFNQLSLPFFKEYKTKICSTVISSNLRVTGFGYAAYFNFDSHII